MLPSAQDAELEESFTAPKARVLTLEVRSLYFSLILFFFVFQALLGHINYVTSFLTIHGVGVQTEGRLQERLLSRTSQNQYDKLIHKAARHYRVDPLLIKAIIQEESNFDPKCRSHRGARGLMQIMPQTARWYHIRHWTEPEQNIDLGTRYLKEQLVAFHNNLPLALAAYNAGPNAVKRHYKVPAFHETRWYVQHVIETYHSYLSEQR